MELRQLEILISIADHGSFSGAAKALATVQSNVSAHISRLEKELATSLIDRSSGRLTEDGQIVVDRARRVLNQIQDIVADVHSNEKDIKGEVRLGCIGTTGRWLMPRFLPAVAKSHPNIQLIISEGSTSSLLPRVLDGSLDAAIVHLTIQDDNLESFPLFAEHLILLVHAKHEWAEHDKMTIQELTTRPLLLPPKNTSMRRILDRAAGSQRLVLQSQAEIDGVRLLTSLAFEGFGAAIVPATAVPGWLKGEFKRIEVPELPRRVVGWVQRSRPLPSKATQATAIVARQVIERTGDRQPGVHIGKGVFPLKRSS
ncbi:MAG: LysR family transcriptional regulator [Acidimicrobiaceae bacterium]|nr:LysR family transcriptional regulator [Acidimicrobiaceae bacterium]